MSSYRVPVAEAGGYGSVALDPLGKSGAPQGASGAAYLDTPRYLGSPERDVISAYGKDSTAGRENLGHVEIGGQRIDLVNPNNLTARTMTSVADKLEAEPLKKANADLALAVGCCRR